jgi:hypothetical protein
MTNNSNPISIPRQPEMTSAENYAFLRELGFQYIRELSGKVWTDHNEHDPGITIMELLCYAITDLAYRTNHDMKDLLAFSTDEKILYQGDKRSELQILGMFEAHDALTTAPVTVTDYRKLLLKIDELQNAWLYPGCGGQEVKIYKNCQDGKFFTNALKGTITNAIFSLEIRGVESLNANLYTGFTYGGIVGDVMRVGISKSYSTKIILNSSPGIAPVTVDVIVHYIGLVSDLDTLKNSLHTALLATSTSGAWSTYWQNQKLAASGNYDELKIHGLYDARIALEIDPVLGSLNERSLRYRITKGNLKGVEILYIVDNPVSGFPTPSAALLDAVQPGDTPDSWKLKVTLSGDAYAANKYNARVYIINNKPNGSNSSITITNTLLDAAMPEISTAFLKKQGLINEVLKKVKAVLMANRNLCEDFVNVEVIETQPIAFCMDVETKTETDIELLQAKITLAIEKYLNPPIHNYSLKELLEEGIQADEIFNGPYIDYAFRADAKFPLNTLGTVFNKPGFTKTEEIDAADLRSHVYVSDIINLVMDFEEVITVKNVVLRNLDQLDNAIGAEQKWELEIPAGKLPVLNLDRAKITFYKNEIPYKAKKSEFKDTLSFLRAQDAKNAYVPYNQVLEILSGKYRNLEQHYPIQHDLPAIYGTGPTGVDAHVDKEQRAKVKNLKAYLMLFEQVLADYLVQLKNAKWLLSPRKDLLRSYYTQFLGDAVIAPLEAASFEKEIYALTNEPGGTPLLATNDVKNQLYESDLRFLDRRNRFLDHLLARFSENFSDYALMLYSFNGDAVSTGKDLIEDKAKYLENYPAMSRGRGLGFNYRPILPQTIYGNESTLSTVEMNISGVEKRAGLFLGIQNLRRRLLGCYKVIQSTDVVSLVTSGSGKALGLVDGSFKSDETVSAGVEEERRTLVAMALRSGSNYSINSAKTAAILTVPRGMDTSLVYTFPLPQPLNAKETPEQRFNRMLKTIITKYDTTVKLETCDSEANEGMILVEHTLLRPLGPVTDEHLLRMCIEAGDQCGCQDPYSFRVSIVLPFWTGRFDNTLFRNHFEKVIHEELPAHILPKICWISNEQMINLETTYKAFLLSRSAPAIDLVDYHNKLKAFLVNFESLRNVYPDAKLHDCEEGGSDAPITLGQTSLGSF